MVRNWLNLDSIRRPKKHGRKMPYWCRLGFESLEERRLLSLTVPALNSLPGAFQSLYIDFDGSPAFDWNSGAGIVRVNGLGQDTPIPAFSIDGDINNFNDFELMAIRDIWSDVAEKFTPFNINVTTVLPPNFNNFEAVRIIVGGSTFHWLGEPNAGGVATFGGFSNTFGNEGFVFSQDQIMEGPGALKGADRDFVSESIAHEAGHLFGLLHQSDIDANNNVIVEYSEGNAMRAPIMGGSAQFQDKLDSWFNGTASDFDDDDNLIYAGMQDDLAHLYNLLGARPDDFGPASSWTTNDNQGNLTANGIIGNLLDTDGFRFTATDDTAWFEMTNQTFGAMLTPRMELRAWPTNTPISPLLTEMSAHRFYMLFDNLIVGEQYVVVASSDFAYGSLGQYKIVGTVLTFAFEQDGVLYVRGYDDNDDDIQLDLYYLDQYYIYVDNIVNGNLISVLIPLSRVNSIVINTGGGHDSVRYLSTFGIIPSTVDLGSGLDILEVNGSPIANFFDIAANSVTFSYTPVNFNSSVELLSAVGYGGDDTFTVLSTGSTGVVMYGGEGNDTANYASAIFGSSPGGGVVFSGDSGSDTMSFGSASNTAVAYTVSSSPFYSGAVSTSIAGSGRTFNHDGVETIRLGGSTVADHFNINYVPVDQAVIATGNNGNDTFALSNSLSGTVTANGNDGDDNFIVGDGNVGFLPAWILNGGNDNDKITFDNRLASINHTVEFQPNQVVFYGGVFTVSTLGFETVGWLGGSGNDQIRISGNMSQGVNIDAGGGGDTIVVGYGSRAQFFGNNTINGGAGNDAITWRAANNVFNNGFSIVTYAVSVDGGVGYNTLTIDDSTRVSTQYDIYADRIKAKETLSTAWADFNYDNMLAMSLSASDSTTNVRVYGTSSDIDIGNQISMSLGGGNDNVYLYPHDAQGNLTINGNVGIGGGPGADSLYVDDSASSVPAAYAFANPFGAGTQNITGVGSGGFGIASDFEAIGMTGSAGDDVYNINSYKSGMGLTISAGLGDDTLNFGNGNLPVNVTNIAAFTFDGQDGYDTFNLNNTANSLNWQHGIFSNAITSAQAAYNLQLNYANAERLGINAGGGNDSAVVYDQAPGVLLVVNGGNGNDTLVGNGGSLTLENLHGPIQFNGEGGADNRVTLLDYTDATGDIAHVDQNTIGSSAGDNLFGAGGSLYFTSVARLDLNSGTGADTIYAQPNLSALLFLNGNNPTTAPGDTLNLALAMAENYVVNGTPANGNVTSSNLKTLSYTGFETGPIIDDAAPYIVSQSYDDSGVPTIFVQFSEDVSISLSVDDLELTNITAAERVPSAYMSLAYDAGTNTASFTFPGYPGGILPVGDYSAIISGTLTDLFGNQMSGPPPQLLFTVAPLAPVLPSDYNLSGEVEAGDYIIWRKTLGTDVANYSGADGSGNGNVGPEDYDLWRANFGQSLPLEPASLAVSETPALPQPVESGGGQRAPSSERKASGFADFGFPVEQGQATRNEGRVSERWQVATIESYRLADALIAPLELHRPGKRLDSNNGMIIDGMDEIRADDHVSHVALEAAFDSWALDSRAAV